MNSKILPCSRQLGILEYIFDKNDEYSKQISKNKPKQLEIDFFID